MRRSALYAASYLRERGHSVALFDAMLAESVADWGAALERHRPRIAAIYEQLQLPEQDVPAAHARSGAPP